MERWAWRNAKAGVSVGWRHEVRKVASCQVAMEEGGVVPHLTRLLPGGDALSRAAGTKTNRSAVPHHAGNVVHRRRRIPSKRRPTSINEEQEQIKLAKVAKISRWLTVGLTLALLVHWPMPMFG